MANNQTPKLRAFVRIDGSGRVVPGAPIFQANKPKVGQWREIPLYYRGDNPSTTTSTTTATPSTTTTTTTLPSTTTTTTTGSVPVFTYTNISGGSSGSAACNGLNPYFTAYSNSPSFTTGTVLYTDSSLTTPVSPSSLPGYFGDPYFVVQTAGIGFSRFILNSNGTIGTDVGAC